MTHAATTTALPRSIWLAGLALGLAACVASPTVGVDDDELVTGAGDRYTAARGSGTIEAAAMQALYDGINPTPHSEQAYQASDPAPPLAAAPTIVGRSGVVVALATTIYNRPPFGAVAQLSLCDRSGRVLRGVTVGTPGRVDVAGLAAGAAVYIRPETLGTMAKVLTPEQIAAGAAR